MPARVILLYEPHTITALYRGRRANRFGKGTRQAVCVQDSRRIRRFSLRGERNPCGTPRARRAQAHGGPKPHARLNVEVIAAQHQRVALKRAPWTTPIGGGFTRREKSSVCKRGASGLHSQKRVRACVRIFTEEVWPSRVCGGGRFSSSFREKPGGPHCGGPRNTRW